MYNRSQAKVSIFLVALRLVGIILTKSHRMDLHEDSEADIVTATFELPGLKKEDVEINVHDGRLTVTAESKISDHYEKDGYVIRERRFGKYARTLHLPHGVRVRFAMTRPF
jgi:HSP20 family molecular chaperone IbpA